MNRYRVTRAPDGWPESLPFRVGWDGHDTDYGIGDEFDREFTETDEADNLAAGLIEIVPREYRVLQGRVYEAVTGETFTAALTIGQESHLVNAGFIERVEPEPAAEKPTPRSRKKVKS